MRSHILGKIDFDEERLSFDKAFIRSIPRIDEEYDEFSSGYWTNVSLWNASGEAEDTTYRDIPGAALRTDYGQQVPYLDELVSKIFDEQAIKMVRARNLIDAILFPHRDFVELDKSRDQYFRVLIALEDNEQAFHSEDDAVLRMRSGEIWYLDAGAVHAAVNFSTNNRQAICVDFAFDGDFDESDIFTDKQFYNPGLEPAIPSRMPFTAAQRKDLLGLGRVITRDNFKEVVALLSKIHFRYEVPAAATFDWLIDICHESSDSALAKKSVELKDYMIGDRKFGERFSMSSWED